MGFHWKGPNVAKIKHHSLTGRITLLLMYRAFRNVRRNRGAAGIDRESIAAFEINLEANLLALMRRLKEGTYQPLPLRRVHIPKGQGQTRPLGIPAVRDRVAQEVVRLLLSPLFERIFHDDSYGFRPDRNCHMAVQQVLELHQQGYTYVLDADIKGFFDNLPHQVIMAAVAAEVADGTILDLVERFLKAGVMEEGVLQPTTVGTPQGGVISPCWPTLLSIASTGSSTTPATALCAMPTISWSSVGPRFRSRRHTTWCNVI
jgi:group II intron reverse transcriptase/maturase